MQAVTAAVTAEFAASRDGLAPASQQLLMISALADGTDQIAADAALANGYALHAVLPFPRAQYRASIAEPFRDDFDRLADCATSLIELRGSPGRPLPAYVAAGRATVMLADLMIAVWDGGPPRGRGGTGEVVELAVRRGVPVIHIPVDPAEPVTLILSDADRRPLDRAHLSELVRRRLPRAPAGQGEGS